jgi:hypothetical protein
VDVEKTGSVVGAVRCGKPKPLEMEIVRRSGLVRADRPLVAALSGSALLGGSMEGGDESRGEHHQAGRFVWRRWLSEGERVDGTRWTGAGLGRVRSPWAAVANCVACQRWAAVFSGASIAVLRGCQ